ncbi:MAG TPA: carboxymuconolactone decarboxylase family protein [Candidatus Nitrosopolaris sp.]|nr:carboxymuconolactone decarboxylase family protein [Candidatus Nitrosopolaris sp.]
MSTPAALSDIEWSECLLPTGPVPREMSTEVRRIVGALPGWVPRLAPSPWIVRVFCDAIGRPSAYLEPAFCGLVNLVVSQDNSCRYCYGAQRAVMKILGYRDDYVDRLVRDFHVVDLPAGERAGLDYARRLSRADPRPGRAEREAVVRAGFDQHAVTEIAALVALGTFNNRVATLLALPPDPIESFVRVPLFRVIRPVIARRMRPRVRPPEPPPQPNDGPLAALVTALGDSPAAGVIRRMVDGAWTSPVLPRRTRALLLAVVARALGCAYSEGEARRLLAAEGLAAADVDEILTHLGSPRLDPREARLVPFARETVRYQPAAIQRRAREACEALRPEETLEAIGTVALANALGRLSVVLDAAPAAV